MRALKDSYSFIKALAAVFCCTLLITQSGLLFGQEVEEKNTPGATPTKPAEVTQPREPTPPTPPTPPRTAGGRRSGDDADESREKPVEEIPPLAEMLATALENNPDIGVAASQVTAAEAQLKRAQLSVVQQVMDLQETWHTQKQLVDHATASVATAEKQWKYVKGLYDVGQPSGTAADLGAAEEQKIKAEVALILAQAKLAEIKAKIPYVLGTQKPVVRTGSMLRGGTGMMSGRGGVRGMRSGSSGSVKVAAKPKDATPKEDATDNNNTTTKTLLLVPSNNTESPVLAKLREALTENTELDFQDQPIDDVADYLRDLHNISITFDQNAFNSSFTGDAEGKGKGGYPINCRHAGISLGAALQAIMDLHPQLIFVVRDYGLLVTVKGKEPEGAISVSDFLKWQPGVGYVGGYVPQAPGGAGGGQF